MTVRTPLQGLLLITCLAAAWPARADDTVWSSPAPAARGPIVFQIAAAQGEDPAAAGKAAALALKKQMGGVSLRAVLVSECYEDKENKEKLLAGVWSVLPKQIVVGQSTYGSFTQAGCTDADSVCLLGIGGDGIGVCAALTSNLGTSHLSADKDQAVIAERLHAAGSKLAGKLHRGTHDRLLLLLADAHSPKNQSLVEGVQQVTGKRFPITGGCANKNAGQTFVYFGGHIYDDSAVALLLAGDFQVALSGRQAKDNDKVISTAQEGAIEALAAAKGKPLAALAFNCAGRRSKLTNIADELAAMQKPLGRELPLFGCYCAGEIGPVDKTDHATDALSGGVGWHVMFTIISRP